MEERVCCRYIPGCEKLEAPERLSGAAAFAACLRLEILTMEVVKSTNLQVERDRIPSKDLL
jgi:hypothetical protein